MPIRNFPFTTTRPRDIPRPYLPVTLTNPETAPFVQIDDDEDDNEDEDEESYEEKEKNEGEEDEEEDDDLIQRLTGKNRHV